MIRKSLIAALSLLSLVACAHQKPAPAPEPVPAPVPQAKSTEAAAPPAPVAAAAPAPPAFLPDEPFRAGKPAPLQMELHFEAPVPVSRRLSNGAKVLVVESHQVPLVHVELMLPAGINVEQPGQGGLSNFVASMLDEGSTKRDAFAFKRAVDDLAAQLSGGAGAESITVHVSALTEAMPQALDLFAEAVLMPAFRPADVERVRPVLLSELAQKKASPYALAADELNRLLYGPTHPWGRPSGGTLRELSGFQAEDLRRFHSQWFVPQGAVFSVAGDITPDEAVRLLEQRFGGWKGKAPAHPRLPAPPPEKSLIAVVDKPGASQSAVLIGGRIFGNQGARHPQSVALRIANNVLGGLFGSRLNLDLRERLGYSYGVRSGIDLQRASGVFTSSGGIQADKTAQAIAAWKKDMAAFAAAGPTEEELAPAREAFIRSLPNALETTGSIAHAMGRLTLLGLPLDYYRTLSDRARAVELESAISASKQWITPQHWPIVIVGPADKVVPALEKEGLGPVVRVKLDEVEPAGGAPSP